MSTISPRGIHLVVIPARDACHGLVSVLAAFKPAARYDYVGCQKFRIGHQCGIVAFDFERAYKYLVFLFDYLYDLCFGILAFSSGGYNHAYFVTVEGVHGVALGHHYGFVVYHHGVTAVGTTHECAYILVASV